MRIAFYKGTKEENNKAKLFDKGVCWWTGCRFSHAELVIADTEYGSICWSSSFRDGGIRKKLINLKSGRWEVYEVDWDVTSAIKWFEEHNGSPYDALALFGFIIPFTKTYSGKYFCTESIAASVGVDKAYKIGPRQLLELIEKNNLGEI